MSNIDANRDALSAAHDAFDRMKRASDRGTGCHLTKEMIQSLSLTFIADTWSQPDPRINDGCEEDKP